MKKNKLVSVFSLVFVLALAACASGTQTPQTESIMEEIPQVEESDPAIENALESDNTPLELPSLESLQAAYEQIYDDVLPSVVSIEVTQIITHDANSLPDIPFDFNFPEGEEDAQEYQESGEGSGFVWDTEGHIITNYHVVENTDTIRIRFADGTSVLGEVIGTDSASDLAVVKVDVPASQLKPIRNADSTKIKVGQIVIAIGNPFRLNSSMTTGIISGLGRSLALGTSTNVTYTIPDVIQTDAAINPGNSGGVLVDISGQLVGVTTAIESPVKANAGVGYVVPSIIVQKIVPFLIEDGSYEQPYIGISGSDLTPELAEAMNLNSSQRGALIIDVNSNTPAEAAGLQGSDRAGKVDGSDVRIGGDVIIAVDDQVIADFEDLTAFLARYANVGQIIEITYLRDGQEEVTSLTLAKRPGQEDESVTERREVLSDAWLGITGLDLNEEIALEMDLESQQEGVLIQQITAASPADAADLRGSYIPFNLNGEKLLIGGDIITAVDDTNVNGIDKLTTVIGSYQPGDEITLSILREGKDIKVNVTLDEKQ